MGFSALHEVDKPLSNALVCQRATDGTSIPQTSLVVLIELFRIGHPALKDSRKLRNDETRLRLRRVSIGLVQFLVSNDRSSPSPENRFQPVAV